MKNTNLNKYKTIFFGYFLKIFLSKKFNYKIVKLLLLIYF